MACLAILLVHDLAQRRGGSVAAAARVIAWSQQTQDSRVVVRDDVNRTMGFACRAAEENTAITRRDVHGVVQTDRREKSLVGRRKEAILERLSFLLRKIWADVVYRKRLPRMRRRIGRIRLRRPAFFTRHFRAWNRALLDRPNRFARFTIEHVKPSQLARHDNHVPVAPIVANRCELRRSARIHVPEIVMHELKVPTAFACPRVECDD
jgi:hypothetical protein